MPGLPDDRCEGHVWDQVYDGFSLSPVTGYTLLYKNNFLPYVHCQDI